MTNLVVSGLNSLVELRVFVALANGIRGYTNKVRLRGLRDFQEINYPDKRTTETQRTQREEK